MAAAWKYSRPPPQYPENHRWPVISAAPATSCMRTNAWHEPRRRVADRLVKVMTPVLDRLAEESANRLRFPLFSTACAGALRRQDSADRGGNPQREQTI